MAVLLLVGTVVPAIAAPALDPARADAPCDHPLWCGPAVQALFPTRAFRSFDRVRSGALPQHSVNSMAQDDEGVLWIATLDGVATFDGAELHTMAPAPHAPQWGPQYVVIRRRGGGVYVGGENGVHLYDGRVWDLWPTLRAPASLAEGAQLWMVDQLGELWRRDPASPSGWVSQPLPEPLRPAVAVAAAGDGAVWVAGLGGVMRFDAVREGTPAAAGGAPAPISALAAASDGTLWIGTAAGRLYFARSGATAWTEVKNPGWQGGRILCLAEDRRGRMWAGGGDGRVGFGRGDDSWTNWGPQNGLRSSAVRSILADREGTLWFGFVTDGLQQWLGEAWSHRTSWSPGLPGLPGLSERERLVVPGLAGTSDGGFLATVFSRGVWRWNGTLRAYGRESGLTEDARYAVEPRPGTLWVGTRFGIFESRDGGPFQRTLSLNAGLVTGFFRSPDGTWYATSSTEGLFSHGSSGWKPAAGLNRELAAQNVRGMTWLRNGDLWVATLRGVTVFRGERGETLAPDPTSGVPASAHTVLEVGDGEIWVGAFGGIGVWRDGRWRVLTAADGIPGHTVYSLKRAPDGSIWAGGSAGVGRFSNGRWTVYDSRSGLTTDECNVNALWIAPDGSVLVGTMGALARFDPRVDAPSPAPLRVFWRAAPRPGPDGVARLPRGQRSLHLTWSAPWLRPDEIEYRTRIARLRSGWSEPHRDPVLAIENLGPGPWDIEVSAKVQGREDWGEPVRLRVFIEPFVWETAWARAALAALGVLAIVGLVRMRTRHLSRRASELQRGIQEALAKLRFLNGLLPICASCKKIRDDRGYWNEVDCYVREHSEAEFSHGICPECLTRLYPEYAKPRDAGPSGSA